MVDLKLIEQIDLYFEKVLQDLEKERIEEERKERERKEQKKPTTYWYIPPPPRTELEKLIDAAEQRINIRYSPFVAYLFKLIDEKNFTDVEVYKRAHLDRRIFSKIRLSTRHYIPSKRTILAISFGMKLNISETNNLLSRAGYELTRSRKEDIVIEYFLENKIYDFALINEVLEHYGFKPLGDSIAD